MLNHLFRQNAEMLHPYDRMACVAERLFDLGYGYSAQNEKIDWNPSLNGIMAQARAAEARERLNVGAGQDRTDMEKVYYTLRDDCDDQTLRRNVIVLKMRGVDGYPDHVTVAHSIKFYDAVVFENAKPVYTNERDISVADFLAQRHPHPLKSFKDRLFRSLSL